MSDVLRGGIKTLGVPGVSGDFKLQLKRPKPKNAQNVPELVAKFGELKRKMIDLAKENESLKQQLIKAHETNSLLAQENTQLKQKASQVLDVEATIDQSIEELLSVADGMEEEKVVEPSKIPRPVRFSLAKKETPQATAKAPVTPVKIEPTMRGEVRPKASALSVTPTFITKTDNVPSPFEVVDLTLVKKGEQAVAPASSKSEVKKEDKPEVIVEVKEAPKPVEKPVVAPAITISQIVPQSVTTPAPFFPPILTTDSAKIDDSKKDKPTPTRVKLEAVNDAMMQDVAKYLLGTMALPEAEKKEKIVAFLNLDIMPKAFVTPNKESKPKDIIGDKVAKLSHLTEEEKARLYADLNTSIDDFFTKELTENGTLYI